MNLQRPWLLVLSAIGLLIIIGMGWFGFELVKAFRSAPAFQYKEARRLWEFNSISHYRMTAYYTVNWAQCYYDVEVLNDRIVHTYSLTCISNAESKALTVGGIFANFERYATQQVCSPNGCYCEGTYTVRATYDPDLGYPQSITTTFQRSTLFDLLRGKWRVQECLRTDPVIEKIEVIDVTPLE